MINAILSGIIKLIIGLVSIILLPIDAIIMSALPSLDNAFTSITTFFNFIGTSIGWCIDATGLSSECISLIVIYFVFKLTAPLLFYMIKLALSWYNKLKL